MSTVSKSPQGVVTAISVVPKGTMDNVMARVPSSVRRGGKVYSARNAQTPEQRAWYLAAVGIAQPTALHTLGKQLQSKTFDFDAEGEEAEARAAMKDAQARQRSAQSEVTRLKAEITRLKKTEKEADYKHGECLRKGKLKAIVTVGISRQKCRSEWGGKLETAREELSSVEAALNAAEAELETARTDYQAAKKQLDDALAEKRRQEEAAKIEAARMESELRAEQARQAAEERRQRAEENAEAWKDYYASQGYSTPEESPDYYGTPAVAGGGGYVDDPFWDFDAMSDAFGGPHFGADMMESIGEEVPPYPLVQFSDAYKSPYDVEVYYCDDGGRCGGTCVQTQETHELDASTIIVTILSIVLAIAPVIINLLSPPPAAAPTDTPDVVVHDQSPIGEPAPGPSTQTLLLAAGVFALLAQG